MSTLVLCPSRGRPDAAKALAASFEETRRDPGSRLVFIVDKDDVRRLRYPDPYVVPPHGDMGGALREAAADPVLVGDATSVGVVGDDCRFRTPGWDVSLDGWLTGHVGIAWPDDGWDHPWSSEEKAAHWWVSRPIFDAFGIAPPTHHLFMDDYWAVLAKAADCGRYFPDVLVEHLHPMAGKAPEDDTYRRHRRFVIRDRRWWHVWQRDAKARDARRLRALVRPRSAVRVFADWHHPALWEALSRLFEDRFGWQLYSPLGAEWIERGWTLRDATPGWEAADYLVWPDAAAEGDHYALAEPEYARRRKLVTWEQFDASSWDFIVASVGPHQTSFAKLARERGSTYVHHIGDAKRRLERTDPAPVVLASTRLRSGIVHHQEFDAGLFAFDPLDGQERVSSFMLRLDSTSGPYGWVRDAGLDWWAVECDAMRGPGYVAPMARVAEEMRTSGWVWHDKIIGDGYGHVLFTAAAMGRPLVGHARHYRGLLGERLWDDLVTCVDLDKHDEKEAARLIRAINRDPGWHAELGANIRARFDELVDFDAEAEAIRAALR